MVKTETKIIFIVFLVFLVESLGSAHDGEKINILEEKILSDFDDIIYNEDEDEIFDVWRNGRGNKNLVNVDTCGAIGDGTSDDTKVTN